LFLSESEIKPTLLAYKKKSTLSLEEKIEEGIALIKDLTGRKADKENLRRYLK
jgi:hypothetical protein